MYPAGGRSCPPTAGPAEGPRFNGGSSGRMPDAGEGGASTTPARITGGPRAPKAALRCNCRIASKRLSKRGEPPRRSTGLERKWLWMRLCLCLSAPAHHLECHTQLRRTCLRLSWHLYGRLATQQTRSLRAACPPALGVAASLTIALSTRIEALRCKIDDLCTSSAPTNLGREIRLVNCTC